MLWDRCSWSWGGRLWSYDRIGAAFKAALADARVLGVFFRIDSPGGLVDGLFSLIDQIRKGAQRGGGTKPVWAFAGASAFSAAYAIAAACDRIIAAPEGEVGSIGAVMIHVNEKAFLERLGFEVTPIEFPDGKTSGAWWEALSEEARTNLTARVSRVARLFIRHVAETRPGFTDEAIIALRAQCFSADDETDGGRSALALGLIDGIANEPAAFADFVAACRTPSAAANPALANPAAPSPQAAAPAAAEHQQGASDMDPKKLAALQAAAKKGDKAAQARLASIEAILAQESDEDETTSEEEDDDTATEDEDDTTAEDEDEDTTSEEDEDEEDGQVDAKTARAILGLKEAKGRDKLAAKLATTPGMTVKRARGLLAASSRSSSSSLSGRVTDPNVRSNATKGEAGNFTGNADCDAAIAAYAKAGNSSRIRKPAA